MAIWVSSDWHCDPDKLKGAVIDWVRRGKEGKHRLVGDGDLFNILPWGREKWKGAASVKELAALLDGYRFEYVAGNHDPYNIMKRLLAPHRNITVLRQLHIQEDGRSYLVTHGYQWAVDWGFLGLRRIAPWLVETAVDVAPGLWYRFCRRVGWLASRPSPGASAGKEQQRITNFIRVIWAGASSHALKRGCCVIIGHTHTTGRHEHGVNKQVGFQAYMVDGGDLPDGTFVEITSDAALRFL